jgi:hypothetical protein
LSARAKAQAFREFGNHVGSDRPRSGSETECFEVGCHPIDTSVRVTGERETVYPCEVEKPLLDLGRMKLGEGALGHQLGGF